MPEFYKKTILVYNIDETVDTGEVRCFSCGSLLAKRTTIVQGVIEIKCRSCKAINKITIGFQ